LGDYLCAKRPIVSNAVGEVKYYLTKYNCGYVGAPSDIQSLASNIVSSLDDSPVNYKKGANARNTAENVLDWNILGKQLDQIVATACER